MSAVRKIEIGDQKKMPNRYAFLEGKLMPLEDAKISVMTHAFLYGTSIFEGIRAYFNTQKQELYGFRLVDHYVRFQRNCRILNIHLKQIPEELAELTVEILRKCEYREDVYIRPVAYKSAKRIGLKIDDENDLTIFALPMGSYLNREQALNMVVSSWRRIEDNAIPARGKVSGSYVNLSLAAAEARDGGFDEAILLNEDGSVSEAAGMNICIVRNGKVITPPVSDNVLEGITRDSVFEIARDQKIAVEERSVDRSELYIADEVFICGTGAEISGVGSIDRRKIADGQVGPVTRKIQETYFATVRGKNERYKKWLTPVWNV
jgi:branched-chain amino acid aminotransferase